MKNNCPFKIGDKLRFNPSERTQGLYPSIENKGVSIGEVITVGRISDDCYIYSQAEKGGWPWNEWEAVESEHNQSIKADEK